MRKTCATLLFVLGTSACSGASSPERLVATLQEALAKGDVDAVLACASLEGAPAMAVFMLADLPNDCDDGTVCTVANKPLDAEWKAENARTMAEQGAVWSVEPEGLVAISAKEEGGSMDLSLPYAKVDGQYRIVIGTLSPEKRAELEATTPRAAAEHTLELGIYDDAAGERDLSWKTTAAALPADGGEAGAAFLAKVAAMAAAIKANDPDAAAATGEWAARVFGAKDYDGTAIPLEVRKRKLRAQATRQLVEARVLGGWRKGDTVVLVIEGTNGVGNTVRGASLWQLADGKWQDQGQDVIEIPKA